MKRCWYLLAVLLVGSNCSFRIQREEGPAASETPALSVDTDSDLAAALLDQTDVDRLAGLPSGTAVSPLGTDTFFENPDPRGPCGAVTSEPQPLERVGVSLRSTGFLGFTAFQLVSSHRPGEAQASLDEVLADLRPGCPPFESRTNTGGTQRVSLLRSIDLTGIGDQAIGTVVSIGLDDESVYAAQVVVRRGDVVSSFGAFSEQDFPDAVFRDVAVALDVGLSRLRLSGAPA